MGNNGDGRTDGSAGGTERQDDGSTATDGDINWCAAVAVRTVQSPIVRLHS
jgi:hypothetical protein